MNNNLVKIPIPFSVALVLLKQKYTVHKESFDAETPNSPSYLIWLDGSNTKAKAYGMCYGEYEGEPRFGDAIYRLQNGVLNQWSPSQSDLYAKDYHILCKEEDRTKHQNIITPLLPYGTITGLWAEVQHGS